MEKENLLQLYCLVKISQDSVELHHFKSDEEIDPEDAAEALLVDYNDGEELFIVHIDDESCENLPILTL